MERDDYLKNYGFDLFKGRYGIDSLSKFLAICYVIALISNMFLVNFYISLLEILLVVLVLFRTFSKNTYKRVKENRIFLEISGKIKEPFRNLKRRFVNRKTNIYRRCPKCRTILKLPIPKSRGIKHTTCPDCKTRFGFFTIRKKRKEKN